MVTEGKFAKLSQADVEDLAEKNPTVRLEEVVEALKIIRELHRMGLTGSQYNVRSPYSRSPIHSTGDDGSGSAPIEDTGKDGY